MEKFTAIYIRVSSEKQVDNTSLGYQEEACRKRAMELGIPDQLIKVYREEGFSGEDIERPQMDSLRDDVKNNLIKNVIIVHPDRLSRNMVDRLIVTSEFEKHEIDLIFVDTEYKQTEEGKLFFNISSSIAEYELALIKKRTRRGTIKSVEKGEVMPMRVPPYGYDYLDKKLILNKTESQFVKNIFQWYVYDKLTIREIGEKLCSLGAIPKRKDIPEWSASSIAKILKNETYIGKLYYNRRQVSKVKGEKTAAGRPKKVYQYRDEGEWLEIPVDRIIDDATFSLAQDQREMNTKHSGNVKHEYLLRQKIRCGHCGNKFASYTSSSKTRSKKTGEITSSHSYRNYRCTNKVSRKFGENVHKCESKVIRSDEIEQYIWDELIMKIIYKTDEIIHEVQSKNEKPSKEIEDAYNLLKFKMVKFEEEKKRLIQLFKKGYIDEEEMDSDMKKLQDGSKGLKKELEAYEQQMFTLGKNQLNIEILKKEIEQLKLLIDNDEAISFKTRRKILDYFIDEIILKWEEDTLKVTTIGLVDTFMSNAELRKSSTQWQDDIDTTNVVFNIVFETLLMINSAGRSTEYEVKEQKLRIS